MSTLSPDQVKEWLKTINYPGLNRDIVSFGFINQVEIDGNAVHIDFQPSTDREDIVTQMVDEMEEVLLDQADIEDVNVEINRDDSSASDGQSASPAAPGAPGQSGPSGDGGRVAAAAPGATTDPGAGPMDRQEIPGVQKIVAVASGKGGVGKSTVAVNLAAGLAEEGYDVALADMDIYGPSAPTMLGIQGRPKVTDNDKILPLESNSIRAMSIGFVLNETEPVVWRGPMVMKAVTQFLRDVEWGERDIMVIDLPPGTGDAQLTLMQKVPLSGAVIVTTPQDVALIDAQKGVEMFRKLDVPIIGIAENMSTYVCPSCGHEEEIFGSGGGRKEAMRLSVPFLGGIPIDPEIRVGGDEGEPIVFRDPESRSAEIFREMGREVFNEAVDVREIMEEETPTEA